MVNKIAIHVSQAMCIALNQPITSNAFDVFEIVWNAYNPTLLNVLLAMMDTTCETAVVSKVQIIA